MIPTAEKNRKQRFSHLPISIGLILKTALIIVGYSVWGVGFIWVVLGLRVALSVLRGILSCLVRLAVIIALIYVMLTFL